mgnify:CR=1 FL=1
MSKRRSERHELSDEDEPLPKKKKPVLREIKPPNLPSNITEIKDLADLIGVAEFIEKQQNRRKKKQGLWKLSLCIQELKELNSLIGLKELKEQVTKQIMFFILGDIYLLLIIQIVQYLMIQHSINNLMY